MNFEPLQSLNIDRIRNCKKYIQRETYGLKNLKRWTSVSWAAWDRTPRLDRKLCTQNTQYLIIIWFWRMQWRYCTTPPIGCWFQPFGLCTANQRRVKLCMCVDNFSHRRVVQFSRCKVLRTVHSTTRKLKSRESRLRFIVKSMKVLVTRKQAWPVWLWVAEL